MANAALNKAYRAGRYVQQPTGYRAFVPALLPPRRLFDHPIVTVARVRQWLHVTPAGANNLVNRLVDIGLLKEITGYARNRRFRFDPYLRLFEEPDEARA
jgi:hypothetical protein